MRLKAVIGNDALWVPPRLWVYAAEHQPDGNLSNYTAEELAMLVGYSGDAQALLKAMLGACFLDSNPIRIHGWAEHNGFHKAFSERASKAARARWEKNENPPQRQEMKRDEMTQALLDSSPSIAPSIASSIKNGDLLSKFHFRLGALFNRRATTSWSKAEIKAVRQLSEPEESDWKKLEAYYRFNWPEKADYRRRDLLTLLNNFDGELDRARQWKEPTCL